MHLDQLMGLIMRERKMLVTLCYTMFLVMAYYGPNAELLGDVKLVIWQYQNPINDIQKVVLKVLQLLVVDSLTFITNGALLWKFCGINLIPYLKKLQGKYWRYFAVAEAFLLMEVCARLMY